jgi:hypothetical protein
MARILERSFTVLDIAEPLPSFSENRAAEDARIFMEEERIGVVGIRAHARVSGFLRPEDITPGVVTCREAVRSFDQAVVLRDSASLPEVIEVLATDPFCFVSVLGDVGAVVIRHDIDKPPVRMWLFGIVTILDMFISRKIHELFPEDSWQERLSPKRLEKAIALRDERLRRKQPARLLDCLQLTDKAHVLMQDAEIMAEMGFASKRESERAMKNFESLRNNLAHVQSVVTYDWPIIVNLAGRIDKILSRI